MGNKLDAIDFTILSQLRDNAKTQVKEMARELRMHPNTLLQRIRKLERSGIIKKYTIDIDFSKAGFDLPIIVSMKVKRGRAGDLDQLKDLVNITEIEALYAASGIWDVMAIVRVKNREHMLDVIQRIGDHPLVTKTASAMILFGYKSPGDYNPFI